MTSRGIEVISTLWGTFFSGNISNLTPLEIIAKFGKRYKDKWGIALGKEIYLSRSAPKKIMPGVLAHEGTHLLWTEAGHPYVLNAEWEAYQNQNAVNSVYAPEYKATIDWVEKIHPHLDWDYSFNNTP